MWWFSSQAEMIQMQKITLKGEKQEINIGGRFYWWNFMVRCVGEVDVYLSEK